MKKFLAIALLILCITAKKHHKQATGEDVEANPMFQCFKDHCMDQAFECLSDEACTKILETCGQKYGGKHMQRDKLMECTANNELSAAYSNCMNNNCAQFAPTMRFFDKRK
ncbi:unnamed protein product [Paramecium sonneborni]|uniref:Uncharacterized protein n=1 Tax=Paramecium sonneborni TaxID=65129 RepID=A0A8S1KUE4_9CILI|nr:unnamed protein product [Paramecium sonneborni]